MLNPEALKETLKRKNKRYLFKSATNNLVDRLETFLPLSRFDGAWCKLAAVPPKAASPVLWVGVLQTLSGKTVLRSIIWRCFGQDDHLGQHGADLKTNHKATHLICWVHHRGDCKEEMSLHCLGGFGPVTSPPPSTSPGLGCARLEGKSPGTILPGGFWQLHHMVPCSETSLSAFPSSGLCLLLDQMQAMNTVFPIPSETDASEGWMDISWWTHGTCINNYSAHLLEAFPMLGGHKDTSPVTW